MKRLETRPSFRRVVKKWDRPKIEQALEVMRTAAGTFGQPHLHAGRGIREVHPGIYECRLGLGTRLLFRVEGDALVFEYAGTHDEVRKWWKSK